MSNERLIYDPDETSCFSSLIRKFLIKKEQEHLRAFSREANGVFYVSIVFDDDGDTDNMIFESSFMTREDFSTIRRWIIEEYGLPVEDNTWRIGNLPLFKRRLREYCVQVFS